MRVLIVDDHILFRQGLTSLFKNQPDFKVVGDAECVAEAVEKARILQPDLVLMDHHLPDGSGFEATEAILSFLPGCNIVFLTVSDDDDTLFTAIRKGARGFLLKSLPISRLLELLLPIAQGEPAFAPQMVNRMLAECARQHQSSELRKNPSHLLSPREVDVLRELASGATNHEIACRMFLAENTVKHYVHNILDKLSLRNRREAAQFARSTGI